MEQYINKVIQGDCLEVMKGIPDKSVDMILADLPYGTTACKWDTIIPFEPLWEQYKRIIKDNGAIVLTASQPFTSALVMSNPKMFKYEWIWEKDFPTGFPHANYRPMKRHENILVFSNAVASAGNNNLKMNYFPIGLKEINKIKTNGNNKGKFIHEGKIGKNGAFNSNKKYIQKYTNYPQSIIQINRDNEKTLHPTQKPVALFEYLIKTYTNEGDLVLDNCAGSGTTGVACKNLNRNYILIEKEPEYIDIINKRLSPTQSE